MPHSQVGHSEYFCYLVLKNDFFMCRGASRFSGLTWACFQHLRHYEMTKKTQNSTKNIPRPPILVVCVFCYVTADWPMMHDVIKRTTKMENVGCFFSPPKVTKRVICSVISGVPHLKGGEPQSCTVLAPVWGNFNPGGKKISEFPLMSTRVYRLHWKGQNIKRLSEGCKQAIAQYFHNSSNSS